MFVQIDFVQRCDRSLGWGGRFNANFGFDSLLTAIKFSAIFRGPIQLKQFAAYTLNGNSAKKRSPRQNFHQRRHGHQHFHEHNKEIREVGEAKAHEDNEKRAYGDLVTATIYGKVDVFTDNWDPPAATPVAEVQTSAPPPPAAAPAPTSTAAAAPPPAASSSAAGGAGSWGRVAYYDAASATAEGLTFLANVNWSPES
jgi:hypothetical protein